MEEKRIADYFVIAGLSSKCLVPVEEFVSRDGNTSPHTSTCQTRDPITDITVIITSQGELPPKNYVCIDTTPFGFPADLNHGSIRSPNIYLCFKRGTDRPPLVDIGVLYESKERVMSDSEVVHTTPYGRPANVNNSGSKTYLTYRRAKDISPCNQLVVMDICVILANKGETPPHAFCLINKTLNKGMVGSDVYICYKKSMNRPALLRYQPTILDRFPLEDYDCYSLPMSVALFCMPMGATIECWPKAFQQPRPLFSTFVLTSDTAKKVYGAAVTFYERYNETNLNEEQKLQLSLIDGDFESKMLHVNKSICILSRWPFFDAFEKFLLFLYRTQLTSITNSLNIPIERYISHFLLDVPFPSIQRPKILVQFGINSDETVLLSQPLEDMPLPLSGASFHQFLRNLGPENCMNVLLLALTEQKILFHSLRPDVLTGVAEAVTTLIFPFHWQCPYIPLCPLGLCDVLNAPLPFIVGVDSRYFDMYEPPIDVACVDLDTNSIYLSEHKRILNIKLIPKRAARTLKSTLERLFERLVKPTNTSDGTPYSFQTTRSRVSTTGFSTEMLAAKKFERQIDFEIQEACLRFMASILRNFRSYLLPITRAPTVGATDPNSLFDFQGFLRSRDRSHQRFYSLLMRTQMFTRFIEERSFASDKDITLAFFDECLDKLEAVGDFDSMGSIRLIETDESQKSDRTVFIPSPEPSSNIEAFSCPEFGPLNPSLFHRHPVRKAQKKSSICSSETASFMNFSVTESPLSRRTKQEIRSAQKIARRHAASPLTWAKCLVSYCYSLWFIHLPTYVTATQLVLGKNKALRVAYDVLLRMQSLNLHPPDEVCYRILMLLCGIHSQPVLAVRVLSEMKRNGVIPNAITYGYYNKAVLESTWPASSTSALLMWTKLKHVIAGVAEFRRSGQQRRRKSNSDTGVNTNEDLNKGQLKKRLVSDNFTMTKDILSCRGLGITGFLNSNDENPRKHSKIFNNEYRKLKTTNSIVRSNSLTFHCLQDYSSQAGILMISEAVANDSGSGLTRTLSERKRHKSAGPGAFLPVLAHHPTGDHNPRKACYRSYSFGNDAKIIRTLKEGPLRALRCELQRNHQIVPEEMDEPLEDAISETDRSLNAVNVPNNGNVPSEPGDPLMNKLSDPLESKENENSKGLNISNDSLCDSNSSQEKASTESNVSADNAALSPLKSTLLNMDFFSPDGKVASSIRSSFRKLASNYQQRASISKSTTFHSSPEHGAGEKLTSKISGILKLKSVKSEDFTKPSPKTTMTRSATLPSKETTRNGQGIANGSKHLSLTDDETRTETSSPTSPWTSKIANSSHLEYVNSTIKSAANSMANRITGLKNTLATSATSSPSKTPASLTNGVGMFGGTAALLSQITSNLVDKLPSSLSYDDEDCSSYHSFDIRRLSEDDLSERSREGSVALNTGSFSVHSAATAYSPVFETVEQHYSSLLERYLDFEKVLEITMTSCCRCYKCSAIVYDEEIMELWSADYSNLNTQCPYCSSSFVPLLTVKLKFVQSDETGPSTTSESPATTTDSDAHLQGCESGNHSCNGTDPSTDKALLCTVKTDLKKKQFVEGEPFTVPYLSPLVLRKEVENVIQHEGDNCLDKAAFIDDHPIIYWNLIWYFERVNLPSHLPGLCLSSSAMVKNDQALVWYKNFDYRNVAVECLWDNEKLHEDFMKPMFCLWGDSGLGSPLLLALVTDDKRISHVCMKNILSSIQANDLVTAMQALVKERRKTPCANNKLCFSLYRDLLFLSVAALGAENIDQVTFDREYRRAYDVVSQQCVLAQVDKPPSTGALFCRRFFKRLKLKTDSKQKWKRTSDLEN